MTEEDEEFNRVEREAAMRMKAVGATVAEPVQKPMHPEIKKMYEDYFDRCFRASPVFREWVGLTDEEIDDLSREMVKGGKSVNWLSRAIEQRLKEKNQ
jgi:hypothetical protein